MTHLDIFKGLASAGFHKCYGENPGKEATMRYLWEIKHIIEAGFQDYYIMAFWIYNLQKPEDLNVWAFGAMSSSVVCHSLGLTKVDPLKYGLHSARFVNGRRPRFQFNISRLHYEDFIKRADEILQLNIVGGFDAPGMRESLLGQLSPFSCLDMKCERSVPDNIDDEVALYALKTPDRMNLSETYTHRMNGEPWEPTGVLALDAILAPTRGLLIYQEQVMDILRRIFRANGIDSERIRAMIYRSFTKGEKEPLADCKTVLFDNLSDGTAVADAERAWELMTSMPHAYLKAHSVSRVLLNYHYDFFEQ